MFFSQNHENEVSLWLSEQILSSYIDGRLIFFFKLRLRVD